MVYSVVGRENAGWQAGEDNGAPRDCCCPITCTHTLIISPSSYRRRNSFATSLITWRHQRAATTPILASANVHICVPSDADCHSRPQKRRSSTRTHGKHSVLMMANNRQACFTVVGWMAAQQTTIAIPGPCPLPALLLVIVSQENLITRHIRAGRCGGVRRLKRYNCGAASSSTNNDDGHPTLPPHHHHLPCRLGGFSQSGLAKP